LQPGEFGLQVQLPQTFTFNHFQSLSGQRDAGATRPACLTFFYQAWKILLFAGSFPPNNSVLKTLKAKFPGAKPRQFGSQVRLTRVLISATRKDRGLPV
jgi:hypothetical protein